jgi:mannose-1-phosphate guanylyltransferase / phosphomannomutase
VKLLKAVIIAGGEGSRLRPLTCNIPKPMLPVLDKPVMEYVIELLRNHGINEIIVTLQYLPNEIISYFGNGSNFGVKLDYYVEDFPLGTVGGIKNIENQLQDTFVVISGDTLSDIDLSQAIKYHRSKMSVATLILKEVTIPLEYGVVVTDKEGKVTGFLEKPNWSEVFSDKVNTGIYILEPDILSYFEKNQRFDFSNDLFPILLNHNKPVYGYITEGFWCDIGSIEQYIKCQHEILKGHIKVKIKGKEYTDGVWLGENCDINPTAVINGPAFIGNNCSLYKNVIIGPFTILGKNNILSNGSVISRSIFFDNCYLGYNTEIKGAVICSKVQLESRVAVFEGSAIGTETLVGEGAVIKPGVKIWPSKVVESGNIVNSNLIWGGKFSRSIFLKKGVTGEVNVDVTPEFVSKLGSAYGSLLNPDSKVTISCSDNGAAQMFKYSLATGLLSMGIEVYDLKKMTVAMTRHAAMFFGVQGAIHVTIDIKDPQKVKIIFLDEHGLNIDKSMERKIESSFIKEDFRRIKTDAFKKLIHMNDCIEYYTRQLINQLSVQSIRDRKFRFVLSVHNPLLLSVIEKIFSELKINVKLYHGYMDLKGLKQQVMESGADLGVYISYEGEFCMLVDDTGNIIKDDLYEALCAFVLLRSTKLSTLVAPVTASLALEQIATLCGVSFIRTKTSQKSILETYIKAESILSRREVINAYLMSLDAVSVLLHTLNIMSKSHLPLSDIIRGLPKFFSCRSEVKCPWNMKGKVMRNLIENSNCTSEDLIEGVKINSKNSWGLVLPHRDEPICEVYTESIHLQEAKNLCQELVNRIEALTKDNEGVSE